MTLGRRKTRRPRVDPSGLAALNRASDPLRRVSVQESLPAPLARLTALVCLR